MERAAQVPVLEAQSPKTPRQTSGRRAAAEPMVRKWGSLSSLDAPTETRERAMARVQRSSQMVDRAGGSPLLRKPRPVFRPSAGPAVLPRWPAGYEMMLAPRTASTGSTDVQPYLDPPPVDAPAAGAAAGAAAREGEQVYVCDLTVKNVPLLSDARFLRSTPASPSLSLAPFYTLSGLRLLLICHLFFDKK